MIYKVTFHVSTFYIYQISSTQELSTLQDMQERRRKLLHNFILYTRNFLHGMENKCCIMGSINENKQGK